jgi:anti-sigma regulatory factor (Ser/Thr protein kinase)
MPDFAGSYPGDPEQVRHVRRDLTRELNGCPVADESILVVSELCANATIHSNSGKPGGKFTVRTQIHPGDCVWIEVADQGGVWDIPREDDDRPHGLDIVAAIAGEGNWGIKGDSSAGRTVWVRLDWRAIGANGLYLRGAG